MDQGLTSAHLAPPAGCNLTQQPGTQDGSLGSFWESKGRLPGLEGSVETARPSASLYRGELKSRAPPTDNGALATVEVLEAAPQLSLGRAEETCPGGLLGRRVQSQRPDCGDTGCEQEEPVVTWPRRVGVKSHKILESLSLGSASLHALARRKAILPELHATRCYWAPFLSNPRSCSYHPMWPRRSMTLGR